MDLPLFTADLSDRLMGERCKEVARVTRQGQWADRIHSHQPIKEFIPDMDSCHNPPFGQQEGSAYNAAWRASIVELSFYTATL
jgi:hypothetical protein